MKKIILLLLFFTQLTGSMQAQNPPTISVNLSGSNLEKFINEVEKQTHYHFFYIPEQFDSLRVSLNINNSPLTKALDQLFSNTDYHYTLYNNESVFLTKGKQIRTDLASQFLPGEKRPETHDQSAVSDYIEVNRNLVATLQNKLYVVGLSSAASDQNIATISGYIQYSKTGEPAVGISISVDNPKTGATTNPNGFYSLTLPIGKHILNLSAIGIKNTRRQILLQSDGMLDIRLEEYSLSLKEVVITANTGSNVKAAEMGIEKLSINMIKQVPTVFGEADILRVVLTLPGVKSVGESSTGFNVRGGSSDQNLILFDDATIYNPSHFFGFFSAFNPDVVKDVELYKNSIPSKLGGRLSSVLEVSSREGNKKKITGTAGLGLLTSRLSLEGPIIKDKTSFILGGRTTYSNWILKALPKKSGYKNAVANFNDLNLNISHQQNPKNNFQFTGYLSNDKSDLASDTTYSYNNSNFTVKWKHTFNQKLQSTISGGMDQYKYQNYSSANDVNAYRLRFNITQTNFKADFNYSPHSNHFINFGLNTIYYSLQPGELKSLGNRSLVTTNIVATEQAAESAIYLGDRFEVSPAISLNLGIRFSMFNNLGPGNVNIYTPTLSRDDNNITNTDSYNKGDIIKTYMGPEYRFSARFALSPSFSVKAGYNTLRQYIHMLSNSASMSPTDIWKLSDMNIKPQRGEQFSLGLYKNFKSNSIETSVEGYFKNLHDYLDYRSGATLILNHNIEQDVLNSKGKAYGIELFVKKVNGKLNGWVSYTYSRTVLKTDETYGSETVNSGSYYPANHDKPHDFTLIGNYRFSKRINVSVNTTHSTGRPITLPIARYSYLNGQRVLYSDRNAYRVQDYFRTDLSMNIDGNHKIKQFTHNSWTIGVYNLTGRKNPFANYFVTENGVIRGYKLSIFGTAIPFVNYNIRF